MTNRGAPTAPEGPVSSKDEIEVTPAMVEAGVLELREKVFGMDLGEIVQSVYLAMTIEREASSR